MNIYEHYYRITIKRTVFSIREIPPVDGESRRYPLYCVHKRKWFKWVPCGEMRCTRREAYEDLIAALH